MARTVCAPSVLCPLLPSAWDADSMLEAELPSCDHEVTASAKAAATGRAAGSWKKRRLWTVLWGCHPSPEWLPPATGLFNVRKKPPHLLKLILWELLRLAAWQNQRCSQSTLEYSPDPEVLQIRGHVLLRDFGHTAPRFSAWMFHL